MSVPWNMILQSARTLLNMAALLGDCFRVRNCQHVYIRKKPMAGKEVGISFFGITVSGSPRGAF